jgi:ABC-type transport system substrate-binding protein
MLEWRQDDQIVMEAFEDHWNGAPPIDNVIFRVVPDDAARVAGLRSGELDVIFPIPPALAASLTDPNLEIHEVKGTTRTRVQIDTREAPFDDIRVREALTLAVDPQVILDELLPGFTRIPNMVNPEDVGFDPELPFYEYDPERARELLAEAGYPDGIGPFELSVNEERLFSGDEHLVIAEQLAAAGIEVNVKVYPTDDFDTRLLEELGNPDSVGPLFLHGHSGGQTWHAAFTMSDIQPCGPDGTSVHEEHWHYCNDQAVEMVQESISLWPTDPEGSTEILKDVDRLLWEDFWAIPLWQISENYGMKSNLNWVANSSLYMAEASWDE